MNLNIDATTLRSSGNPLFSDLSPLEGETPLPGLTAEPMLVNPNVIKTYERIIFSLQQQVLRYQMLLSQLTKRRDETAEDPVNFSTPLSEDSAKALDSIIRARIPAENILRVFDEEEM